MLPIWVQNLFNSVRQQKDFECDSCCLALYELHRNGTAEGNWLRCGRGGRKEQHLSKGMERSHMEKTQRGDRAGEKMTKTDCERGRMRMGQSCWSMSDQLLFLGCFNNLKRNSRGGSFLKWS